MESQHKIWKVDIKVGKKNKCWIGNINVGNII